MRSQGIRTGLLLAAETRLPPAHKGRKGNLAVRRGHRFQPLQPRPLLAVAPRVPPNPSGMIEH